MGRNHNRCTIPSRFVLNLFCYILSVMEKCQAYTMELEAEVAKLKEENQELRKKQVQSCLYDTVSVSLLT